ncbi:hypothetical protein E2N92_07060 [Methanofollis formosanus]|uniref:Uncharacterized protein n=1 Tax=Methanofollis formosanus TaxID=299308 RepID=A0A8G1A285_9EURY|nr:hypothetical protein [Methanofollis formosanus]QYZ79210.1 hypothetical protein E2N92_07060 [Methanofollis formosanus]
MISPSPRNGVVFLGLSNGLLLGAAATAFLWLATASLLLVILNGLVILLGAGTLLIWRFLGGLSDALVFLEIGGITVLEFAICMGCVLASG